MTMACFFLGSLVLLVLVHVLREPLRQVVQQTFVVLGGVLNTIVEGLRQALSASMTFWRRHFGQAFGIRPILGSVFLVGVFLLLAWADFALLRLTFASLLPEEQIGTASVVNQPVVVNAAGVTAVAVIALEVLTGFLAFELFGWTDFMEWEQRAAAKTRKGLAFGCLGLLLALCLAHAGLAAWRTAKIQQSHQAEAAAEEILLSSAEEGSSAVVAVPEVQAAEGAEVESWIDRLPIPVMAFLGFLFPLAAAAGAVGIHPLFVGTGGIGMAVLYLFPLSLALGVMNLLLNFIGYAGALAQACLDVLVGAGGLLVQGVRDVSELIGGPRERSSTAATFEGSPEPPAQGGEEALFDAPAPRNEPGPDQALAKVVDALSTNPFEVDGALLRELRSSSPREERGSAQ